MPGPSRCHRCRTRVSRYAEVCPRCGVKSPGEKTRHPRGRLTRALLLTFAGARRAGTLMKKRVPA